ncbi:hypothetical protein CEB3_c22980 [Peptococcaceae bacterium CEB3]|nr:hypothetical protein CEB3_c22980 [Peptococcaceae bacterium CEB3]
MAALALGLIIILAGLVVLALGSGWFLPYFWTGQLIGYMRENAWETMAAGVLLVLVGLLFFLRPRESSPSFALPSRLGEVRITEEALREIIARAAQGVSGVQQVESALRERPEGLEVRVSGQLHPGVAVAQVSEELQNAVRSDVEQYTGIKVAEVKVLVRGMFTARPARVR